MDLASAIASFGPGFLPPLLENASVLQPWVSWNELRPLPDCSIPPLSTNAVCDTSLSLAARADALVDAFTFEEKLNATTSILPPIDRIGLPTFNIWNEALHGVGRSAGVVFSTNGSYNSATSFPMPILIGAAFDDDLVYSVADVISTEIRAFANVGRAGLDVWTPNVNPFKDPRWGRGPEVAGEDPFHVSSYTRAFVGGIQGSDPEKPKVVATCKHYAAYDLEYWHNITRFTHDAVVSTQDLAEYYMPAFESCVRDAKAGSIMSSYNSLNGIPTTLDTWLLQDLLRTYWGWEAPDHYITTDCFSLDAVFAAHDYTSTPEKAAALAFKAGTDSECGAFNLVYLPTAVEKNLIDIGTIERAIKRVYASLIKQGYFDPATQQPYRSLDWSAVNTPDSQALARKAASSGMVLLKNDHHTLPLQILSHGGNLTITLTGTWANATEQMLGGYFGIPPLIISPLEALRAVPGVSVNFVSSRNVNASLAAASKSDVIIYVGGLDQTLESEGSDRESIAWPSNQTDHINALAKLRKPLIIAQAGGGQLDDSAFLADTNISAVLWIGYPGQAGGLALTDILFGKVAPAGRLTVTQYPAHYVDDVPMTDMALRPSEGNPGRTYKWYTGEAVLPFGHGLHYTTFDISASMESSTSNIAELVRQCNGTSRPEKHVIGTIKATVQNKGNTTSDYVALAFLAGKFGPAPRPLKQLVGYKRSYDISPGTVATVDIPLHLGELTRWDDDGRRILYPGVYMISIDTLSENAHITFNLTGKPQVLETWPQRPAQG